VPIIDPVVAMFDIRPRGRMLWKQIARFGRASVRADFRLGSPRSCGLFVRVAIAGQKIWTPPGHNFLFARHSGVCGGDRDCPNRGRGSVTVRLRNIAIEPFLLPSLRHGHSRERRRQFTRLEPKWARLALVGNFALPVNQVNAVGPAGVGQFRRVTKLVQNGGELYAQFSHACSCDKRPFLFILRTGEDDPFFNIAFHLPDVTRMGFGDVNHKEGNATSVLLIELVEGGSLPPKWGSGVAAEHEDHRLLPVQR
jgi:hypothetical protein